MLNVTQKKISFNWYITTDDHNTPTTDDRLQITINSP